MRTAIKHESGMRAVISTGVASAATRAERESAESAAFFQQPFGRRANIGAADKVSFETSADFVNRLIRSHVKRPDAALDCCPALAGEACNGLAGAPHAGTRDMLERVAAQCQPKGG
jgi:hypothetical protein